MIFPRIVKIMMILMLFLSALFIYWNRAEAQVNENYRNKILVELNSYRDSAEFSLNSNIGSIVGIALRAVLVSLGLIFISLFIYGGYLMVTSAGNTDLAKKGKDIIINALYGVLIIIGGYAIAFTILSILNQATQRQAY